MKKREGRDVKVKKRKRKTTCERKGKKKISQYETELARIVYFLLI